MPVKHLSAWDGCAKVVEAATRSCAVQPQAQTFPTTNAPNWDAMANSFASLSTAFTWGSIILACAALIGGLAWGWIITGKAENEARTEAGKCAKEHIDKWLEDVAPGIIRQHVENIINTTVGGGNDPEAADDMGKAAG